MKAMTNAASPAKKVTLCAPRGFCAGVDRAVEAVERALEKFPHPIYVRKEIVHNKHVVDDLSQRGAIFVDELDEVPSGELVVFSAHGISPAVRDEAKQRNLQTIDATCPLVTKVHREAVRFAKDDLPILLIGHESHEEVEGTMGEAPGHMTLIEHPEDVDALDLPTDQPVAWLTQTTLSVDETKETIRRLREKFPLLVDPPSDDICYATQNRQDAVKRVAADADLVIVVGSANSSNSNRLVEVAISAGTHDAHRVDDASELDPAWLEDVTHVGVTSGASVPDHLVAGVLAKLEEYGFLPAVEEQLIEETMTFSLPPQVRDSHHARTAK